MDRSERRTRNSHLRHQWILDLCNPDVQDFIFGVFDDLLSSAPGISYVKWDANRYVNNVGSTYLPADEQSRFWDYTRGLYNVYERIRSKYPDIEIQACASGGGRVDFGSLPFHDEIWTSDNTNAIDRIFIQWGHEPLFSRLWQWLRMFPLLPTDRPECRCRSNSAAMWQCRDAWASNYPRKLAREEIACCRMLLQPIKRFALLCSTGTFIGWFLLMMKAVGLR